LEYGNVEVSPRDMADYQHRIKTDIGVILYKPTGFDIRKKDARSTVMRTLEAAKDTSDFFGSAELWTGPIQGGRFLDLVRYSAKLMRVFPFDIFALGSPTQVMESYNFHTLLGMIRAAKKTLPLSAPLHLFGAGHPLTLPVAVALGCDLFDSASYILYAKQERYLTRRATKDLSQLKYFECSCSVCRSFTPKELGSLDDENKIQLLAEHNLHVIMEEIHAIRQSIHDGDLWEYVKEKAACHPKLSHALSSIFKESTDYFLDGTPIVKDGGVFVSMDLDYFRPEFTRFRQKNLKMRKGYRGCSTIIILPFPKDSVWYKEHEYVMIASRASGLRDSTILLFDPILGLIPLEIADVYPASHVVLDDSLELTRVNSVQLPSNKSKTRRIFTVRKLEKVLGFPKGLTRTFGSIEELLSYLQGLSVD
jgi:7-cyano-7-deazaguanine tRNA-ribosyltransferase